MVGLYGGCMFNFKKLPKQCLRVPGHMTLLNFNYSKKHIVASHWYLSACCFFGDGGSDQIFCTF
jgi:hypothetical protein